MADYSGAPISKIEPLTGDNYYIWALKVSAVLRSKRLFKPVIEEPEPEDIGNPGTAERKARENWEEKNDDAFGIIILTLSPEQAGLFINERNAKKVWTELKNSHAGNVDDRRIDSMLELKNLTMTNNERVDAYITRAKSIATKCASLGQVIQSRELVYYIVRGLNYKLENIASILRPQRSATLEEIQQALNEEEERLGDKSTHKFDASEKAFKATGAGRGRRNTSNDKRCFVCGKIGHIANKCWHRKESDFHPANKNKQENTKSQGYKNFYRKNEHAKFANKNVTEHAFKAIEEKDEMVLKQEKWNLDSGCTSHMSPYSELLTDMEEMHSKVNLAGEGGFIEVEGKGDVRITTTTKEGKTTHICVHDVLYVPKLRSNLLSVSSLINQGNQVVFNEEGAKILNKDHEVIAEAREEDRMYILEAKQRKETENEDTNCMSVERKDEQLKINLKERWHKRLGHVNENYLNKMNKYEMVIGLNLPNEKLETCESCIMGKLAQTPFTTIDSDGTTRTLELIHMDLCGPMPQESLGGSRYMFVMVDSYSRRIFVEFLRSKDEAFLKFVEFKNRRENEVQSKIQNVRTDNGKEFVNNRFMKLFKDEGINHQKTTPYTPQSNGIAERANRTLLEKARTMLIDSKLPNEFWAEAVATAAYTHNCTPTRKGGEETPMEKWSGRIPTVKHMKVFGSISYSFVPKNLRSKLDPKAKKGIFVGYARGRKAYRIFDLQNRKIHEVRSVKFDEDQKGGMFLNKTKEQVGHMEPEEDWMPTIVEDFDDNGQVNEEIQTDDQPPPLYLRTSGRKTGDTNEVLKERHLVARKENEEQLIAQGARRSERIKAKTQVNLVTLEDPTKYEDILGSPHKNEWEKAMDNEINSLATHEAWKLVLRKPDMKVIKSKWVYTTKRNPDGSVDKRKARLVAAGYNQRAGIDFEESFSPVMKMESFRTLLAIAAHKKLKIRQYDVQTAYLNSEIKEKVFMEQPCGYIQKGDENKVCELQKSIYGLPQSGRTWNEKIKTELLKSGLTQLESDPCIYIKHQGENLFILGLYVDDLIVIGTNDEFIDSIMGPLKEIFVMTEKQEPEVFLGIQINEDENGITLSQESYITTILERFGLSDCNPTKTPGDPKQDLDQHEASEKVEIGEYREMIGSLMYLANGTRPDIAFHVSKLSQYLQNPKRIHLTATKRVYRYLKGTKDRKLFYTRKSGRLVASADASWCNTADAKSFSGYTIKLGNSLVNWKSKKQGLVALSTCEAELMAICESVRELKWITSVLSEMGLSEYIEPPVEIKSDSQAAIDWIKCIGPAARTKHINRKYYFVRDEHRKGNVTVKFQRSEEMEADFLTKSLSEDKIVKCNTKIGNM